MTEETSMLQKSGLAVSVDSTVMGVSVRAWLAMMLVSTVCASHITVVIGTMIDAVVRKDFSKVGTYTTVGEPLYSMGLTALGFYLGQKTAKL